MPPNNNTQLFLLRRIHIPQEASLRISNINEKEPFQTSNLHSSNGVAKNGQLCKGKKNTNKEKEKAHTGVARVDY